VLAAHGATSAITLVTLGGAFVAVSVSVNASQQEQLDQLDLALATGECRVDRGPFAGSWRC
jgi:putative lipoic acid-binding regulatory protein